MKLFDIEPRITGDVRFGSDKRESTILAGRLAEKSGKQDCQLLFDASENFVVFEVGKRGSGKSYGMGALLEGFATQNGSKIAEHAYPKAVLLLDPLDVHWTAIQALAPEGPPALRQQYQILKDWSGDAEPEPIAAQVFLPAGYEREFDDPRFRPYQIPVCSLGPGDWALLLKADLVCEPRGRLLDEAYRKVTELGWEEDSGRRHEAIQEYSIEHLVECIQGDGEIQQLYAGETIRSVEQPLRSLARMPLFGSTTGTPMNELAQSGVLSILRLARLPEDLRVVVTTVIVRRLKDERMHASELRRKLMLQANIAADERAQIEKALEGSVPKTVLAIDEAQMLMPAQGASSARKALDSFVLEGRNYGLSLWLATQRPKGAISDAAISQIDTFVVHRLSVAEDISAVCGLLQNALPEIIRLHGKEIKLPDLIRQLDVGQAIFSSAVSDAKRFVVGTIRPRNVAHGGDSF